MNHEANATDDADGALTASTGVLLVEEYFDANEEAGVAACLAAGAEDLDAGRADAGEEECKDDVRVVSAVLAGAAVLETSNALLLATESRFGGAALARKMEPDVSRSCATSVGSARRKNLMLDRRYLRTNTSSLNDGNGAEER